MTQENVATVLFEVVKDNPNFSMEEYIDKIIAGL